MNIEYQTQEARVDARAEAAERLRQARLTEKDLIASGKLRPHRINSYTIVCATEQNIHKYK